MTEENSNMAQISKAIEMIAEAAKIVANSASEMDKKLAELSKEQIEIKKDLLEVKRMEMELKANSIERFKKIGQDDDLDFLKKMDVIENDFLDKTISRARELNRLHKEMRSETFNGITETELDRFARR
jgi:ribosomal 50S subunit-associated protein YjgA (DUF615 family)